MEIRWLWKFFRRFQLDSTPNSHQTLNNTTMIGLKTNWTRTSRPPDVTQWVPPSGRSVQGNPTASNLLAKVKRGHVRTRSNRSGLITDWKSPPDSSPSISCLSADQIGWFAKTALKRNLYILNLYLILWLLDQVPLELAHAINQDGVNMFEASRRLRYCCYDVGMATALTVSPDKSHQVSTVSTGGGQAWTCDKTRKFCYEMSQKVTATSASRGDKWQSTNTCWLNFSRHFWCPYWLWLFLTAFSFQINNKWLII